MVGVLHKPVTVEELPKKLVEQILGLGIAKEEIQEALDVLNGKKAEPEFMMTDIALDIIEAWLEGGDVDE